MIDLEDLTFTQLFWLIFAMCIGVIFFCNWTAAYWNFS